MIRYLTLLCIGGALAFGSATGNNLVTGQTPWLPTQQAHPQDPFGVVGYAPSAPAISAGANLTAGPVDTWALAGIPCPSYLRPVNVDLLPGQGFLVTGIGNHGVAPLLGIQVGQLILSVDGKPVRTLECLPSPSLPCTVTILDEQGIRDLVYHPLQSGIETGSPIDYRTARPPLWNWIGRVALGNTPGVSPNCVPFNGATAIPMDHRVRSLAVSSSGIGMAVHAQVACPHGIESVRLNGSPDEISQQFYRLSPEVQSALLPQLTPYCPLQRP